MYVIDIEPLLAAVTASAPCGEDLEYDPEFAELEALAVKGNSAAIAILHQAGDALGLAIANIIQMNDPEMIVIAHQPDAFDGLLHAGQVKGGGRGVVRRVQEGAGAVGIDHAPLRQDARRQRMAANDLIQGRGNGQRSGFEPGGHDCDRGVSRLGQVARCHLRTATAPPV